MNKKAHFRYSLQREKIDFERSQYQISQLDIDELKGICNGSIYIFFEPHREYIILDTGIIDYLIQLRNVIEEIDSGNHETFSVSCDYYSNSLDFIYYEKEDRLKISDANDQEFEIEIKYSSFEERFSKFLFVTINDLILNYPELKNNRAFSSWVEKLPRN